MNDTILYLPRLSILAEPFLTMAPALDGKYPGAEITTVYMTEGGAILCHECAQATHVQIERGREDVVGRPYRRSRIDPRRGDGNLRRLPSPDRSGRGPDAPSRSEWAEYSSDARPFPRRGLK